MSIRQKLRHFRRYRQIVRVLAKHGLGFIIHRLGLEEAIPLPTLYSMQTCEKEPDYCLADKLSQALMELGPTFVKLGQMLSTRPDLLSPAYIEELERLQDKVHPFTYEQVVEQLVKEIGHPEEVFDEFNPSPLAAASIGQVHLAKLKTGEQVVVKIQRPEIEALVENDLEILINLAGMVEKRSAEAKRIGLSAIVQDYAQMMRQELDYHREAKNTERMRNNFSHDERIIIPRIFWEYTTPRVLTEQFVPGVKYSNLEEIQARGWDRRKLSQLGTEAFLTQVMVHGFFQADPHPGNILIIDENHISFIDFGEVGSLTGKRLKNLGALFMSFGNRDMDGALAALQDMGIVTEQINLDDFQEDLADLVDQTYSSRIGNLNMQQLRKEILEMAYTYELKMPAYLTSLMKALITVEGVGKKLDPTFNFAETAAPLTKKMLLERMKPGNLYEMARRGYYQDVRPLLSLPKNFNNLIRTTGEGRLNMGIQLGFNSEAQTKMTQLVNRISTSLIIAGGLIGSSLIIQTSQGPMIHGYAIFGVIGFSVSLIGLLLFIVSTFKQH